MKDRWMDRWKERQEEGSSKIRKRVDSGILISTVSKGVNILVQCFMDKESTSLLTVLFNFCVTIFILHFRSDVCCSVWSI